MKPIDDFFRNYRELFDTDNPPEGHLNRFYDKLETSAGPGKTQTLSMILKIAAIVVFGLFLSALLYYKGFFLYYSALVKDSCLNTELCEAEDYYSKQAETYYRRIEKMPFTNDPQSRKEILKELREMDAQVVGMKEDLKQNPNDERIIYTIINYYQEKIDMMDMIITRTSVSTNAIL
jgi:hypothetical protein